MKNKIIFSEEEEKIFGYIKALVETLPLQITPRVVGGWVRDKLLGRKCYDIDITVDQISGYEFALHVKNFLEKKCNKVYTSQIGVVKKNPDKSKHLETAVLKIGDFFIDFLSLRTETYTMSRIPRVEIGTLEEDASRRDVTINALYFNLVSHELEDVLGFGLRDLNERILRTPIDPLKTFNDDPLRLLRILRFSATLDFEISPDVKYVLSNPEIKENINKKVSNERIGIEIQKIMSSDKFYKSIYKIIENDLFQSITKTNQISENFFKTIDLNEKIGQKRVDPIKSLNLAKHLNLELKGMLKEENIIIFRYYTILIKTTNVRLGKSFLNTRIAKESFCFTKKMFTRIEKIEKNLLVLDNLIENETDEKFLNNKEFENNKLEEISKSPIFYFVKVARILGEEFIDLSFFIYLLKVACENNIELIEKEITLKYLLENNYLEEKLKNSESESLKKLLIVLKFYKNYKSTTLKLFDTKKIIDPEYLTKELGVQKPDIKKILEECNILHSIYGENISSLEIYNLLKERFTFLSNITY